MKPTVTKGDRVRREAILDALIDRFVRRRDMFGLGVVMVDGLGWIDNYGGSQTRPAHARIACALSRVVSDARLKQAISNAIYAYAGTDFEDWLALPASEKIRRCRISARAARFAWASGTFVDVERILAECGPMPAKAKVAA